MWRKAFKKFEVIWSAYADHFRFFKGCLPQILLSAFLNTLTHSIFTPIPVHVKRIFIIGDFEKNWQVLPFCIHFLSNLYIFIFLTWLISSGSTIFSFSGRYTEWIARINFVAASENSRGEYSENRQDLPFLLFYPWDLYRGVFHCSTMKAFLRQPGHNLDFLCVRQSDTAPFCKNYAKLYFDARLGKGIE